MISIVITFFLFFITIFLLFNHGKRSKKLPPGPTPLPLIGNMIDIARAGPSPYEALHNLSKKYGDVMSVKLGVHDIVVLSSYEAQKSLMAKDELAGRYVWPFSRDRSFHKELGIVFSDGKFWQNTVRFTVKTLRDFGFGKKSSMDIVIAEEISDLMAYFRKGLAETNNIFTVQHNFDLSVINVLWSLVAGFRFDYDDPIPNQMLRHNDRINEAINFNNIYLPFPFLRHWFPKQTGYNQHMQYYTEVQEFMRGLVDNIRRKMDPEGDPQNFVEVYLKTMEAQASDPNTIYTEENLIMIMLDLFLAGSESTNSVIRFALLYMVNFPHVQDKVRAEINSIAPSGEMLSVNDLHRMPYTKATLYETLRRSCFGPIPLAHRTTADVPYKDMIIPKDTCIMYSNYSTFYDEKTWGDPKAFRPERFLSQDGTEVVGTEVVHMAFGYGKRVCPGETLAWNSLFMYFVTMVQNWKMEVVDGQPPPDLDDVFVSFSLSPNAFQMKMTPIEGGMH